MKITWDFELFTYLILKQVFWKTKTFFKELEYCFIDEHTMIESATFLYKTSLPKTNYKTNWTGCTKRTYYKERSFATTTLLFWKFNMSIRILFQIVDLMCQLPKYLYSYFLQALEFYMKVCFPYGYP